jgi:tRNA 2-thiouridine synthesizing protein E
MKYFLYKNKKYRIDSYGFLLYPEDWDEDFACGMAPYVRINGGLTEAHWKVIYFIRNTFEKINDCPLVYVACRENKLGLGELKRLFPKGYLRGACKLAGITYRQGYSQNYWLKENFSRFKFTYANKSYDTDGLGFLLNPDDWDENFAIRTAYKLKMPGLLTAGHWSVIYYLREKHAENSVIPTVYETCEDNRIKINELEKLFPTGYHRGAIKIAGLRLLPGKADIKTNRNLVTANAGSYFKEI